MFRLNDQIPDRLLNEEVAEYRYDKVVKEAEVSRKSHYSFDGEIPEGKYGDLEDEETELKTKWIVPDARTGKGTFESREEAEEYLKTSNQLKSDLLREVGVVQIYGFRTTGTVNRADSLEFYHRDLNLRVYAGLDRSDAEDKTHTIHLQADHDTGAGVTNIAVRNYEYEEMPTVEEFYGAVKMFIESELLQDGFEELSEFERKVVNLIAEKTNYRVAERNAEWIRSSGGDFKELCDEDGETGIKPTLGNAEKVADRQIQNMKDNIKEYDLEDILKTGEQ